MPRLRIIGCSGSGKSTLAREIHQRLGLPWLELDSLHHQPDWTPLEPGRFRAAVVDFMDAHRDWVIDGNYPLVSDLVDPRCTDLAWLDVPLPRVLWQLGGRSVVRLVRRTELWNGNRERLRDHLSLDPERSVLLWATGTRRSFPARFRSLAAAPELAHLRFHRIRGRREIARLVDSMASGGRG